MPVSNNGNSHTRGMKRSAKTEGLDDVLVRLQADDIKHGLKPTDYAKDNFKDLKKEQQKKK